ncbi:helix-turn-helix domain-containing protein [Treponema primitia]|uniref:helix-turn-helix domain-containing protein n=1 Tax=Treponema primitia TaxID=88058 RepID=UPI00397EB586
MNKESIAGLLTRNQAAEYLHVCKTTLDRLPIPRIQIRRRIFFKKVTLEKYLEECTQLKGGTV